MANILSSFSYSLKRIHLVPERRNDPATIEKRAEYAIKFIELQSRFSENQFIYIDETGFNVSMRLSRGRSLIGLPAVLQVPAIRSRNISICCGIRRSGLVKYETKISAYNSNSYCEFLSSLFSYLRENGVNSAVLVMDNVRFHKTSEIRNLIAGSEFEYIYLPPYSPFLNPIENMFSKWKEHVKRCSPQNEEELFSLIEEGSRLITAEDTEGYFRKMLSYISRCISREEIWD